MRGKPCEPAYVVHTAKRVAELRKTSLEELAPVLWKNAERRLRRSFS
jgi:TatD DNase family protein